MKYAIVYLLRGKIRGYHKKLVKELAQKFKENYLTKKNPIPPHITLKSPFRTKYIKEIEKIIKDFTKIKKPSKIKIKGFGNFNKSVIFLKTKFSRKGYKVQKELLNKLGLKTQKFDKKWKPHSTIGFSNTKKRFNQMWKYVKSKNPKFDLKFDNITILKKPRKYWKIYKTFNIK